MTDKNNSANNPPTPANVPSSPGTQQGTAIVPPQTTYTISTTGASGLTWNPNMITYVNVGQGWYTAGGDLTGEATQTVAKKKDKSGCSCKKCKDFNNFAEPNQDDGTFICWSCRHGY